MILSRIQLNPFHARTYALVGDAYELHRRLCGCFSSSRQEASVLFRIEPGPVLLVQSEFEPDWSKFGEPSEVFKSKPECKLFSPEFAQGQRLIFRLRCRPCKKHAEEGSKHSKLRFLRTETERLEWLKRQGKKYGFVVESVEATYERWIDTKQAYQRETEDASRIDRKASDLPAIRFDGIITVTDPAHFLSALKSGIGPQKAYGFGLLSVARDQA
ncbi:MAG: type I-E CRISPR-associated protein Cas6/Cse3/CasE [Fimbriimonadaceae bacterium]|nr:type I-E CRISPR-associated protein Cas6/Cse3/CasE [Fimbriimonadaceae bacterium]